MTAQVLDRIEFRGTTYHLLTADPLDVFTPSAHGLRPTMNTTASWRGYVAEFAIDKSDRLTLRTLWLNTDSAPPMLHGKSAEAPHAVGPFWDSFSHVFRDAALPLDYTGVLQIAAEFVGQPDAAQMVPEPWQFAKVLALHLDHGRLLRIDDRSDDMANERRTKGEHNAPPQGYVF